MTTIRYHGSQVRVVDDRAHAQAAAGCRGNGRRRQTTVTVGQRVHIVIIIIIIVRVRTESVTVITELVFQLQLICNVNSTFCYSHLSLNSAEYDQEYSAEYLRILLPSSLCRKAFSHRCGLCTAINAVL